MNTQDSGKKSAKVIPLKGQKCPMCKKPMEQAFRPFCSRRCANLDLGNWFGEAYRAPTDELAEQDDYIPDED